jgi:cytochrome c-type biogenesis protein
MPRARASCARAWVTAHMAGIKRAFGVLVLALGLTILLGGDKWLEAQLLQVLPQGWIEGTTRF